MLHRTAKLDVEPRLRNQAQGQIRHSGQDFSAQIVKRRSQRRSSHKKDLTIPVIIVKQKLLGIGIDLGLFTKTKKKRRTNYTILYNTYS